METGAMLVWLIMVLIKVLSLNLFRKLAVLRSPMLTIVSTLVRLRAASLSS